MSTPTRFMINLRKLCSNSKDNSDLLAMIELVTADCKTQAEFRNAAEPLANDLVLANDFYGDKDDDDLDVIGRAFADISVTPVVLAAKTSDEKIPLQKSYDIESKPTNKTNYNQRISKKKQKNLAVEQQPSNSTERNSNKPPAISATSRQSRFHTDTLETLSNDIDLKGVTITVENFPLLEDAHLKLFSGVHYGLIGRNGVGKSTLLNCIASGSLIGIPTNLKILCVEQLEDVETDCRVLDVVMDADLRISRLKQDLDELHKAQQSQSTLALAETVRKFNLSALNAEIQSTLKLATKRSGTRGHEARKKLHLLETRQKEMSTMHLETSISEEEIEAAPLIVLSLIEEIYGNLQTFNAEAAESKARKVLNGLGFSKDWQDGPLKQLSGGWKLRVALAQALFMEPDILLLDEPTNHLDLPAILWLQKYLKNLDTVTLVIVSHDRSFLNETVTEIIEMRNRALSYHSGNYDEFVADQEDKQIRDIHRVEALEKKKAHIEKSIQEGLRHAKKTGDDKKLGMVKSRQRKLDERFGLDVNENGHRFKLNRDMAGYHTTRRPGVELDIKDAPPKWSIPEPELPKNKSPLVEMESVSFSYSSNSRNVLQNVTLNIQMSEHIGIVGANGQGKSTLVNLLLKKLVPNKGTVQHHPKAKIAYISQDLTVSLPLEKTPLGLMKEQFPDVSEQELRAHLGGFGVGGIATRPLSGFSGGQRVRVVVALECFGGKNILLLDEPTNHLDLDTIEAMLQALKESKAAVIVVSHDQYFVEQFSKTVYLVQDCGLKLLEGGVGDYAKAVLKNAPKE